MREKIKVAAGATNNNLTRANVRQEKDIEKVLEYFQYKVGTTLDCFFATGVMRNCITWYVKYLEELGLLQVIYVARDKRTHYQAKHYSADPAKWVKSNDNRQLSLFGEGLTWE